jgi:hypothetical protein
MCLEFLKALFVNEFFRTYEMFEISKCLRKLERKFEDYYKNKSLGRYC